MQDDGCDPTTPPHPLPSPRSSACADAVVRDPLVEALEASGLSALSGWFHGGGKTVTATKVLLLTLSTKNELGDAVTVARADSTTTAGRQVPGSRNAHPCMARVFVQGSCFDIHALFFT